ncbi:MAG: hypothetical protein ABMA15_24050, partial [Vicinamibacterales bacterium]
RPDYAQGGMVWVDDSGDPSWVVKLFNGEIAPDDMDIDLFTVNKTTGAVSLGSAVEFDLSNFDTTGATEDDVIYFDGAAAAWGTLADITIDLATDVTGVLPNANLPAAMQLGTDDTTQGTLYLYGDSGTAGGAMRFYNAASEDTTAEYFLIEANSHLYIGPNTDTDQFIIKQSGGAQLTAGTLELGVNDTTVGSLYIYGAATASGGFIRLYNAADEDTTNEYHQITGDGGGLVMATNVGNLLTLADTQLSLPGLSGGTSYTLSLGTADTRRGRIFLYGDNAANGGTLYLYSSANKDITYDYWTVTADTDSLLIGPDADVDRYSFLANRLEATAAGFRAMSHVYTAPSTGTGLEVYYDSSTFGALIWAVTRPSTNVPLTIAASFINMNQTDGVRWSGRTTAEINAISSPSEGTVVYNSTLDTLCFYTGAAWRQVSHTAM